MATDDTERVCVFCRGSLRGSPPEHVIPQWISRKLPKGAVLDHRPDPHVKDGIVTPGSGFRGKAKRAQLTAKNICRACNQGWMSELETRVSQFLTPLLGDPRAVVRLDLANQADLALWAVKTALAYQQTRTPEFQNAVASQYQWVKDHQEPPPATTVRAAFYFDDDSELPLHYFRERSFRSGVPDPAHPGAELEDEVPLVGFRTVILIGPVMLEVLSTSSAEPIPLWWSPPLKPTTVSLWPIAQRVAVLPPGAVIGDSDTARAFLDPPGLQFVEARTRAGVPYIRVQ